MNKCYILLIMVFLHIVDDFYLQGWLASAKQKEWWKLNAPDEKYKNDYMVALFIHGFSWSFMIMIPVFINAISMPKMYQCLAYVTMGFNVVIHAIIDDEKANHKTINLYQDQKFHLIQIYLTWFMFICIFDKLMS